MARSRGLGDVYKRQHHGNRYDLQWTYLMLKLRTKGMIIWRHGHL
jgi:hypothetical protein